MDHHNCLEVLIMRGRGREISDLVKRIRSVRGVKHVTLSMTTTGSHLK
jgi:CopG family nickel-responsive transcriptional regulator